MVGRAGREEPGTGLPPKGQEWVLDPGTVTPEGHSCLPRGRKLQDGGRGGAGEAGAASSPRGREGAGGAWLPGGAEEAVPISGSD